LSDFIGYARTNLFEVKDLDSFWSAIDSVGLPIAPLQVSGNKTGFIWTGTERPFYDSDLKKLLPLLSDHLQEPLFIIVGGGIKGDVPLLECTLVDPSGKVKRNTLSDLTKGHNPDLSDAPVVWR